MEILNTIVGAARHKDSRSKSSLIEPLWSAIRSRRSKSACMNQRLCLRSFLSKSLGKPVEKLFRLSGKRAPRSKKEIGRSLAAGRIIRGSMKIKRRWSRVTSAERRQCETPGCTVLAKERCKATACGQQHCSTHKGLHSAIHTLMSHRDVRPRP
jgi:hypothetical protein